MALPASQLPAPSKRCSPFFAVCGAIGIWFRLLTVLREGERERVRRKAQRSRAIMESPRVKTVEESAGICGFDAHKCVHRTQAPHSGGYAWSRSSLCISRLPISMMGKVPDACSISLAPLYCRLKKIWADTASRGQELAAWCQAESGGELEVVEREPGMRELSILPRRWVVERTLSWISRA